jgi:hypothetical protein
VADDGIERACPKTEAAVQAIKKQINTTLMFDAPMQPICVPLPGGAQSMTTKGKHLISAIAGKLVRHLKQK